MNTTTVKPEIEILDPLMRIPAGVLGNPYPTLAKMQERGPILWSAEGNQWLVTRYEEANSILRNNQFGKRLDRWRHPNFLMRSAIKYMRPGSNILLQDPPDHTRIRSLVNTAFTPKVIHQLEDHITEIADNLLAEMLKKDTSDLISEFAFVIPVTVIAELLGVPASDREQFKAWSRKITMGIDGGGCPMKVFDSIMAMQGLRRYLSTTIDQKRKTPTNDLISTLVAAQSEGNDRLSKSELLANTVLILIAGHETTVNLIGNGTYNFLKHPDQKDLLLSNPDLIGGAVEEVLRYDPPVQVVRRLANEPIEIGDVNIKTNDALTILVGACNRDPRVNPDPDRFDISREKPKHISFGAGIHYCLGAELARTEARIAFRQLFKAAPDLRLVDTPPLYKGPFALRGLQELMVSRG